MGKLESSKTGFIGHIDCRKQEAILDFPLQQAAPIWVFSLAEAGEESPLSPLHVNLEVHSSEETQSLYILVLEDEADMISLLSLLKLTKWKMCV